MKTFLGGVRDSNGRRAFLPLDNDAVVAVDLENGTVSWRREGVGRPAAVTGDRLLAIDRQGRIRILRADDGTDVGEPMDVGIPAAAAAEDATLEISARAAGDRVRLAWSARIPYRGGAAPPPQIAARARETTHGAAVVDTDRVTAEVSREDAVPRSVALSESTEEPLTSDDPTVVALDRAGGRIYALRVETRANASVVMLESRQSVDGPAVQTTTLDERPAARPGPRRK